MADTTSFINKYKNVAINEAIRTGIPASITMAQAILESGWGGSGLSTNANNFFGIKADSSWKGPVYNAQTHEVYDGQTVNITAGFRMYDSPKQSFKDHSDFLVEMPRYSSLFNYGLLDYRNWARGLKSAGYATSPTYDSKLINLIESYGLNKLDERAVNRKIFLNIIIIGVIILGVYALLKTIQTL